MYLYVSVRPMRRVIAGAQEISRSGYYLVLASPGVDEQMPPVCAR